LMLKTSHKTNATRATTIELPHKKR